MARFMDYYSLFWGPGVVSMLNKPYGAFMCRSSTLAVLADSGPIHCFGVPEWFSCLTNPVVRLRVGHQHWQFWPILARFIDYYSRFWGPGVVSMLNEPCGAFSCRSSTLAVLADFGPFHGLLLSVLGSRSDFHD